MSHARTPVLGRVHELARSMRGHSQSQLLAACILEAFVSAKCERNTGGKLRVPLCTRRLQLSIAS